MTTTPLIEVNKAEILLSAVIAVGIVRETNFLEQAFLVYLSGGQTLEFRFEKKEQADATRDRLLNAWHSAHGIYQ